MGLDSFHISVATSILLSLLCVWNSCVSLTARHVCRPLVERKFPQPVVSVSVSVLAGHNRRCRMLSFSVWVGRIQKKTGAKEGVRCEATCNWHVKLCAHRKAPYHAIRVLDQFCVCKQKMFVWMLRGCFTMFTYTHDHHIDLRMYACRVEDYWEGYKLFCYAYYSHSLRHSEFRQSKLGSWPYFNQ